MSDEVAGDGTMPGFAPPDEAAELEPRVERSPDLLLDAQQVADEILSVPVSWVRKETRAGRIPHVQLGHYVRYRRGAVLAWVEEREQNGSRR